MIIKIIIFILCAILLFITYKTDVFLKVVLKKADTDKETVFKIKLITMLFAAALFIAVLVINL